MSNLNFLWPEEIEANVLDFTNELPANVLAMQLCSWGNIFAGCPPHPNFFNVMDAASKVTGAFTPDQCNVAFDVWVSQQDEKDNNED